MPFNGGRVHILLTPMKKPWNSDLQHLRNDPLTGSSKKKVSLRNRKLINELSLINMLLKIRK